MGIIDSTSSLDLVDSNPGLKFKTFSDWKKKLYQTMINILSLFVFPILLSTVEGAPKRRPPIIVSIPDTGSGSASDFFSDFCTSIDFYRCEGSQIAVTISFILFLVLGWCCTCRCCPCYNILKQLGVAILSNFFFVLCCCGFCGNCNKATWDEEWRRHNGLGAEEGQRRTEQRELRITEAV